MRSFEELVAEAVSADVTGWDFSYLDGRATEERPPWRYVRLLAERLATVGSALDLDTGGGEVLDESPAFPSRMVVTEAYAPNAARARARLGPRGVEVVAGTEDLPDASFDLVTSRHPVDPAWVEIHRVLRPGGRYLGQHVGPASAFELIEHFLGPQPEARRGRDPRGEVADAEAAGLTVTDLRTARLRMEFFDVGAVVWILRACVWWVPDFSVERYEPQLRSLDARMRRGEPVVAHSTRHLLQARR
ncbi:class I SAM-dependent methyltransferase [Brachybacterium huguangmaarense]|uniref:Class I SAM-dependent methyltransferase n=1 Tax=Brachybacterium huguangmaarense TaxID=1652028 RepID=A0ABY6G3M9_9MICO|nr:class I SAM-dependent methyltransferase [Brachybacterium huguangmaarense]UYG17823.1 class I SAM-dependent methyltransferase [Brachybacterium huguangmaarense]